MERKPSLFHVLLLIFTLIGMACNSAIPDQIGACGDNSAQKSQSREIANDKPVDCTLPVEAPDEIVETPAVPEEEPENDFETAPEAALEINAILRYFNSNQETKMHNALAKLKIVLNSEEFRRRVVNFTYQGRKVFVDNRGQTNEQIYRTIMNGAETLNGIIDYKMDLDITLYYSNNSVVGYTYPNVNKIWVNNKFFATYTLGSVAANVAHEWLHKLGYGHDYQRTPSRPYSVPYGVGGIVRDLVNKL